MARKKPITKRKLVSDVSEMTGEEVGSPGHSAAMVLLASVVVGANIKRVAKFTKIDSALVSEFGKRLRENEVWIGSKVAAGGWSDGELGAIEFLIHVNVALGLVVRA